LQLDASKIFPIYGTKISKDSFAKLDLSVSNPRIDSYDLSNLEQMNRLINDELESSGKSFGFGGYIEQRNWYRRNSSFTTGNERDIHIGIDLWMPTGSEIFAPLEGTIHSFKDNDAIGDYGPTIILNHVINNQSFHSLYGHLSRSSLRGLEVGQKISRAEKIGEIGDSVENTGWPTHIHFQLIIDMQNMSGDYPGVTSRNKLDEMKMNCPDPTPLASL